MADKARHEEKRTSDPYLDRRGADDRRKTYDIDYFSQGGWERRAARERRKARERRRGCVKVSEWSSVCPRQSSGKKTSQTE